MSQPILVFTPRECFATFCLFNEREYFTIENFFSFLRNRFYINTGSEFMISENNQVWIVTDCGLEEVLGTITWKY
jgi:hypothetical protein